MTDRIEQALAYFKGGYNCAQSVFAAYADLFGIEKELALRLAAPFGGGLAGMRRVCGTVTGMSLVAGLYNGNTDMSNKRGQKIHYDLVRAMADEFKAKYGSIVCEELMASITTVNKDERPCSDKVRMSATLIEKYILPNLPEMQEIQDK